MDKPLLANSQVLPIERLSPETFENFVCAVIPIIRPWKIVGGPQGARDEGFDIIARRLDDGKLICIQCKRYKNPLNLSHLGPEFAKVGLKSYLESSEIIGHYFVCTDSVSRTIYSALRESDRSTLINKALEAVNNYSNLKTLRGEARERRLDINQIVRSYILNLEEIVSWSKEEFDIELSRVWSQLKSVIERFFQVQSVLQEYPRPDFNEQQYLEKCLVNETSHNILLMVRSGKLPYNLHNITFENPLEERQNLSNVSDNYTMDISRSAEFDIVQALASTEIGTCTLLLGNGGAGKTTTLKMSLSEAAKSRIRNKINPLPIFINLGLYSSNNNLCKLIENSLEINYGYWGSLPGTFLLLCDGLNEVSADLQKNLLQEISNVISKNNVAVVITLRSSGLRRSQTLADIEGIYELIPLTIRQAIQIAQKHLEKEKIPLFVDHFRDMLSFQNPSIFTLPFGVALSISVFKDTGELIRTIRSLIKKYLLSRFERNRKIPGFVEGDLLEFDYYIVRTLAELTAYQLRMELQQKALDKADMQRIIANALSRMKEQNLLEASNLSIDQALRLLRHYEFLNLKNNIYHFEHDLIVDFLASKELAKNWEEKLSALNSGVCDDAWIFAGSQIPEEQYSRYLGTLAKIDLLLAASCAVDMGSRGIDLLEPLVFKEDEKNTLFSNWQSAKAMSILGSKNCIDRLKQRIESSVKNSDRQVSALEALSIIGEEEFLSSILPEADKTDSIPVAKVSGGKKYLWELAPASIALKLARKRVREVSPDCGIVLSINTIARFGDASDVALIEELMQPTTELKTLFTAFYCLYELSPKRAVEKMRSLIDKTNFQIFIYGMDALFKLGYKVDYDKLFSFVMDGFRDEFDLSNERIVDQYEAIKNPALQILKNADLSNEMKDTITCRLKAEKNKKYRSVLWEIAVAQQLDSVDDFSQSAILEGDIDEMGNAASFARKRSWSEEASKIFLRSACERFKKDKEYWMEYGYYQLLEYLVSEDEIDLIVSQINLHMSELVKAYFVNLNGKRPILSGAVDIFKDCKSIEDIKWKLGFKIVRYLTLVEHIDKQIIKDLMHIDLTHISGTKKIFKCLLRQLEEKDVDEELYKIKESYLRMWLLAIISGFGKNQIRIKILKEEISKSMPQPESYFCEAIKNMWCEETVGILIETFSKAPWINEHYFLNYNEIVSTVANRITKDLVIKLVEPMLDKELSPFNRDILQLWYDMGMKRRRQVH